ncbi:MAG: anaerobic ribonucleoside-triphosphate reductase [Candidatus Falkowbacteria bacterium]
MTPIQRERQECTVYSRVVGWITPVRNWNKGKQSEFTDRKTYDQQLCNK